MISAALIVIGLTLIIGAAQLFFGLRKAPKVKDESEL